MPESSVSPKNYFLSKADLFSALIQREKQEHPVNAMLLLPRPSIVMGQRFSPASNEITNNAEKATRD